MEANGEHGIKTEAADKNCYPAAIALSYPTNTQSLHSLGKPERTKRIAPCCQSWRLVIQFISYRPWPRYPGTLASSLGFKKIR